MIKRILVLDDSQDVLDIVKEALTYQQFEVNVCSDSRQFMDIVSSYLPHLVILDYKTGGLRGDDICRKIKSDPKLNDIPVILCSAYFNERADAPDCGFDAVIAKPFGLDELVDKVNQLISLES